MEEINIWVYLLNVAPVVLVMGIGIYNLWNANQMLIQQIHKRDLANLETLQSMSTALSKLDHDAGKHFAELKEHISDRVSILSTEIRSRTGRGD